MDNAGILEHLLKIEAEASALIVDAQAEADKRISDAEKKNRAVFELQYQTRSAEMEAEYQRETSKVRENYQKELSVFRDKMETIKTDQKRFFYELESLLTGSMEKSCEDPPVCSGAV